MEEIQLRLKELLFPSIADVAVQSVGVNVEVARVDARCTAAGAACPGCGTWSSRVRGSYLWFPALLAAAALAYDVRAAVRQRRGVLAQRRRQARCFSIAEIDDSDDRGFRSIVGRLLQREGWA
ncbi:hypothetical protein [Streptomyces sp. NPDC000994]